MPKIAVIILNWNQPLLTQATIKSLLKIKSPPFHLFLVDNHSKDLSFSIFKKRYQNNKKITLLKTKANLGYVGGNNFGIKQALKTKPDFILVSNNDVFFEKSFLKNLIKAGQDNPKAAILGPKIYFAPGYEFHRHRYKPNQVGQIIWSAGGQFDFKNILGTNIGVDQYDQGQFDQARFDLDFISGCCFLINTKLIQKIGLFDPAYFMYLEDVDYCQRALKAGFQVAYIPQSAVYHINAGSSGSGSNLHDYFITRNRLYFAKEYGSFRARFALTRQSAKFLFQTNRFKKTAVFDYYLGRLGQGSWLKS